MEIEEKTDKLFLILIEKKLISNDPKEKELFTKFCRTLVNNFFMENDEDCIETIIPAVLPYKRGVLRFDGDEIRYYYEYKAV